MTDKYGNQQSRYPDQPPNQFQQPAMPMPGGNDPNQQYLIDQMRWFQQEQQKAMQNIMQGQVGGMPGGQEGNMMRMLELQRSQLAQESTRMQGFMKDFMDKMLDMQNNSMGNVHGG